MHLSSARSSFTATLSRPLNYKCSALKTDVSASVSVMEWHNPWSRSAGYYWFCYMGLCQKSILVPTDSTSCRFVAPECISKSGWSRIPGWEVLGLELRYLLVKNHGFSWAFPVSFFHIFPNCWPIEGSSAMNHELCSSRQLLRHFKIFKRQRCWRSGMAAFGPLEDWSVYPKASCKYAGWGKTGYPPILVNHIIAIFHPFSGPLHHSDNQG